MPWKKSPPKKDYYAVIFSSVKSESREGYDEMDKLTMELAQNSEGFLGYESVSKGNSSIFISYWESMQAIEVWKNNAVHLTAKSKAVNWYERYLSQICKVEHCRLFEKQSK